MILDAIGKTAVWFTFSVVLGEGVPIGILFALSWLEQKNFTEILNEYLGHATAPLIGYGVLLAATGDRIIERRSSKELFRNGIGGYLLLGSVMVTCSLEHQFVRRMAAPVTEIALSLAIAFALILLATSIKFCDWRLSESSDSLSRFELPD